jgi:hypothetical protein
MASVRDIAKSKRKKSPAWQRKEGKSASGGLNAKGVASYRRANPGSKLKRAVTTKPSKLKKDIKEYQEMKSLVLSRSDFDKVSNEIANPSEPSEKLVNGEKLVNAFRTNKSVIEDEWNEKKINLSKNSKRS